MSELEQPIDPLPSSRHSLEQFHRANDLSPLKEVVVTDVRDPLVWKGLEEREGRAFGMSSALMRLMWAAYRLVGTLPSEDSGPKILDRASMSPEIEQKLLDSLEETDHAVLSRYHEHLFRTYFELFNLSESPLVAPVFPFSEHTALVNEKGIALKIAEVGLNVPRSETQDESDHL